MAARRTIAIAHCDALFLQSQLQLQPFSGCAIHVRLLVAYLLLQGTGPNGFILIIICQGLQVSHVVRNKTLTSLPYDCDPSYHVVQVAISVKLRVSLDVYRECSQNCARSAYQCGLQICFDNV